MTEVEKVARAIRELKPFDDGDENVEYILIRGLSAIGFQLPAAGALDLAEQIAKAALAALGDRCDCGHTIDDCATRPGLRHCEKASGEKPVGIAYRFEDSTRWHMVDSEEELPNHVSYPYVIVQPLFAHPPRREAVEEAVKAERNAWEAELRPLIDAGALEGGEFVTCENCGAPLSVEEVARVEDGPTGCWRYLTGRDKDPCPGDGRKRIVAAIRAGSEG